ncbi:MAG TPA: hypothetical protein VEX67_00625 [Solirubrobacteraceae bacterium]|nr:hypothetical protein [Solirubrobacteraceae bacterium]
MRRVVATAVAGTLLALPSTAAAKTGCPVRDVRAMLAEAGQGMNGRVIALHETYITIVAESTFKDSIRFDETVRVYGKSLPGVLRGRIGIVVRRDGDRWTAGRCDVVPGWRMANALRGRPPCPKPGVRISGVRIDGRTAHVNLRILGDVTTLRLDSGQTLRRRHFSQPGTHSITETFTYSRAGRFRATIRAEGGFGPGCGTTRRRYATAKKTIVIR